MKYKFFLVAFFFQCWIAQLMWAQQTRSCIQEHTSFRDSIVPGCNTSSSLNERSVGAMPSQSIGCCSTPSINEVAVNLCHTQQTCVVKPTILVWARNDCYDFDPGGQPLLSVLSAGNDCSANLLKNDFVQWLLNSDEDIDADAAKAIIAQLKKLATNSNAVISSGNTMDNYEAYLDYMDRCNLELSHNAMAATKTN